jgi:hypothetical protein
MDALFWFVLAIVAAGISFVAIHIFRVMQDVEQKSNINRYMK